MSEKSYNALVMRVAKLEKALAPRKARTTDPLIAEINQLEESLGDDMLIEEDVMEPAPVVDGMYMDEDSMSDLDEMGMDDMMVDEPAMTYMDDDDMDDLDEVEDEVEFDEMGCGAFTSSEVDPNGIEEQITQDSLDEVEDLRHGEELTTGKSMGAVAPTRSKYVARLKRASARLDRVASYLEGHGRKDLALRIDKIADAVDAKIKGGRG